MFPFFMPAIAKGIAVYSAYATAKSVADIAKAAADDSGLKGEVLGEAASTIAGKLPEAAQKLGGAPGAAAKVAVALKSLVASEVVGAVIKSEVNNMSDGTAAGTSKTGNTLDSDIRVGVGAGATANASRYYQRTPEQAAAPETRLSENVERALSKNCASSAGDTVRAVTGRALAPDALSPADRALYAQAQRAVDAGIPDAGPNVAANAALLARQNGMSIDHALVGRQQNLIIVEGALNDPGHRRASMPLDIAQGREAQGALQNMRNLAEGDGVRPNPIERFRDEPALSGPRQAF